MQPEYERDYHAYRDFVAVRNFLEMLAADEGTAPCRAARASTLAARMDGYSTQGEKRLQRWG